MKINKIFLGIFILIFILSFTSAYEKSSFQLTQPGLAGSSFGFGTNQDFNFNNEVCSSGQDFIIRVVPGGCTPPVVRSDLLEEQNVPVYCQLQALKVNPLITVTSIKSIDFGSSLPEGVSSVGFIPSYPALGLNTQLSNGQWNNIGYAIIFLARNGNESSMPESIVGGLSARIIYDLRNSFGLENYRFYLPLMTDPEFKELYGQYAFFNHMGYLRADDIQTTSASISIYSGLNANSGGAEKQKVLSKKLNVGEESSSFFLPGFGCMASSTLKLDSVEGQDTRAVMKVNSETFEVKKGEYFYDNKCQVVSDPIKEGLRQTVDVRCEGDEKTQTFPLRIEPTIDLSIGGSSEKTYQVGDRLPFNYDEKAVYLGYVGTDPKSKLDAIQNSLIYLVTVPGKPVDKLDSDTLSKVARYAKNDLRKDKSASDVFKTIFGFVEPKFNWLFDGNNFKRINYGSAQEAFGTKVQIKSFGVGTNLDLKNQTLIGYQNNAVRDYKQIQENFANQKYEEKLDGYLGEQALAQLINLSDKLYQSEDLKKYCEDFKSKYSGSNLDISPCENIPRYSNVGVSRQTFLIDGDYKEISFEGVREPSFEEYGIEISIKKGEEVVKNSIQMRKGEIVYLGNLFKSSTSSSTQQNQIFTMNKPGGSGVLYFKYGVPLNQPLTTYQSPKIGWLWSPDKSVWMDTSEYKVVSGSFKDYTLPQESITFLNSLKWKNFQDGQLQITGTSSVTSSENSNNQEYIKLNEIKDEKWASLDFSLQGRSILSKTGSFLTSINSNLEKDVPFNIGGTDYIFVVTKINLKKVAKVSVNTKVRDISNVDFNFTIGIEKRSIQLSPEETKARIESWTNRINVLQGISDNLGTVVKTFQTTCEITGAVLTLKNLLLNSGVESLARKNVMREWNSYCEGQIDIKYSTKEQCLFDNSGKIEDQVSQMTKEMEKQNDGLKTLQEIDGVTNSGGIFGEDIVNQKTLMDKGYSQKIKESLNFLGDNFENPKTKGEFVDVKKVKEYLTGENLGRIYSLEDAKQIELYANLYLGNKELEYGERLFILLKGVENNVNENLVRLNADQKIKDSGLEGATIRIRSDKNSIEEIYDGAVVPNGFGSLKAGEPVQPIVYENNLYYVTLKPASSGEYYINEVYGENKNKVSDEVSKSIKSKYSSFKKKDTSEGTPIKNPEIKYYETDPYKGLPALVPVEAQKGWYAYIPQTVSASSSSRTYDLSARINSFWICNAGSDGVVEYNPMNDNCQLINLGNSNSYTSIGSLKGGEAITLVDRAVKNIEKVSRAYKDGIKNLKLDNDDTIYKVGSPAVDVPLVECTDIMSPADCKILFNACDPVICPSSRCNYGGDYTVRDVIQSGVVGSVMLCLPNWDEGIYVPVCLTGVKAGVDNFLSVAKSYRECLNTSLEKGETVGICDEINSIYMCEFFWRQALPLLNLAVPKIDSWIFGGGARNGGEYVGGIQGALANAKSSADYLVQYYSLNANSAFKARSQEEVGSLVCKNFLSVVYPEGQGALDALTQSRSPPQFTAKFDVIPFSSVTNPPQVQYKVFYHIFAGNSQGAYYRVYLKGDGSSYYSDSSSPISVDSGYIPPGEYETQTKDFTAAEGYNQLCVQVNNQEECGFGTVSTDFAVDYLSDQYIKDQAINSNITSQQECVSGSPNLISLLNPNLEAGISNAVSPDLANEGVTRVCATENPGKGNDPLYPGTNQRWIDVGYCGNLNIRCWIDKQSLSGTDVFNFDKTKGDTLTSLGATLEENLKKQNGFLTNDEFNLKLENISREKNVFNKIRMIEEVYNKVLESNKKGFLLFLRGGIYKDLSFELKDGTIEPPKEEVKTDEMTFISNTFGFSGAITVKRCFRYFENSWHSTDDCSIINLKDWKKVLESDTSFDHLLTGGFLEGLQKIIDRTAADNEPAKVLGNSIGGLYLSTQFVNMNSDKIFRSETASSDLYFKYDESLAKWQWSFDESKWIDTPNSYAEVSTSLWSQIGTGITNAIKTVIGQTPDTLLPLNSLSGKDLEIVQKLDKKGFLDGAAYLFEGREYDYASLVPKATVNIVNSNTECSAHYADVKNFASKYGVDPYIVFSVMYQESRCNPYAVSPIGAAGLMQFTSGTAKDFPDIFSNVQACTQKCSCGVSCSSSDVVNLCGCSLQDNRFDSAKSVDAGAKYFGKLVSKYKTYSNSQSFALASYNGGSAVVDEGIKRVKDSGATITWDSVISKIDSSALAKFSPYSSWTETQRNSKVKEIKNYVDKINGYISQFKSSKILENEGIYSPFTSMRDKILIEAQNLIGSDTFRVTSNGKDYSYVCSTFTSKVLIAANALPEFNSCDATKLTELQSNQNLNNNIYPKNSFQEVYNWNNKGSIFNLEKDLLPGDVIIWGCSTSGCDSKEFQHSTIFEKYNQDTKKYILIGDPGLGGKVGEQIYSFGSSTWYPTHVWRPTLDSSNLDNKLNTDPTIVDKTKTNFVSGSTLWDLSSALEKVKTLSGKYSTTTENKKFVDEICSQKILTAAECDEIDGWWFGMGEEDMNYVQNLLEAKFPKAKVPTQDDYFTALYSSSPDYSSALGMAKINNSLINLQWKEKGTILNFAIDEKDFEGIKYLIENGADPNIKDYNGQSSLQKAAYYSDLETIKYLVEHGADVNSKGNNGETPLMGAVKLGSYESTNYLISKGADINAKDNQGKGLIQYLNERKDDSDKVKIKNLLDSEGSMVDSDSDGVSNSLDKCPGTIFGVIVDENGCPSG